MRCTLHAARCTLHAARCILHAAKNPNKSMFSTSTQLSLLAPLTVHCTEHSTMQCALCTARNTVHVTVHHRASLRHCVTARHRTFVPLCVTESLHVTVRHCAPLRPCATVTAQSAPLHMTARHNVPLHITAPPRHHAHCCTAHKCSLHKICAAHPVHHARCRAQRSHCKVTCTQHQTEHSLCTIHCGRHCTSLCVPARH